MKENERFWVFNEVEQFGNLTPLELFWGNISAHLFLQFFHNKRIRYTRLTQMTFPTFLIYFRKFLKSRGLNNVENVIKEWRHLIGLVFLIVTEIITKMKRVSDERQLRERDRRMEQNTQSRNQNEWPEITRLDDTIIVRNPTYSSRFNETTCSICQDSLINERSNFDWIERNTIELSCGHRLHDDCAIRWKTMNPLGVCPVCRRERVMFGKK